MKKKLTIIIVLCTSILLAIMYMCQEEKKEHNIQSKEYQLIEVFDY